MRRVGLSQHSVSPRVAPPRLSFRVRPEPLLLLRARDRMRDYLRQYLADPGAIDDVVLCVEEACTNAIRHSDSRDDIEILLEFAGGRLVATVKDRGRGFDVAGFDAQAPPDPRLDHGRGLFIIAALMDSLELRLNDGLEVCMARKAEPRRSPSLSTAPPRDRTPACRPHPDARAHAMLEESDEGFVALDWEYRYVYANQASLRLAQKSLEELLGRTPWELFPVLRDTPLHGITRSRWSSADRRSANTARCWPARRIEVRVYPTPTGVSAYFNDITERRRKEEELERLLETEHLRAVRSVAPQGCGRGGGRHARVAGAAAAPRRALSHGSRGRPRLVGHSRQGDRHIQASRSRSRRSRLRGRPANGRARRRYGIGRGLSFRSRAFSGGP